MKKLSIIIVLFLTAQLNAQLEERTTLATGKVVDWKVTQVIKSDTIVHFSWLFQNKKYTHIRDYGSVFCMKRSDLEEFILALETVAVLNDKTAAYRTKQNVVVEVYMETKAVFVNSSDKKYTTLSKEMALKLAEELKEVVHLLKK
jgi:uncharacterized protein YbaA (DUF1428 family)